jgi:hypothetical protein
MKTPITCCCSAPDIWGYFHRDFDPDAYTGFSDFCLQRNCTYEESTINTAIAWNIWKRRNALTFNGVTESLALVSRRCIEDVRLWAYRCTTPSFTSFLNFWCNGYDPL